MLATGHSDNLRMMQLDELNGVQLCRLGQEIVQEIVQRTCDIFLSLKQVKLPNGTQTANFAQYQDRKNKLDEQVQGINDGFLRLREIYDRIESNSAEESLPSAKSILRIEGESSQHMEEDLVMTDQWREAIEDNRELVEAITHKSQHIKAVIDKLRNVMWDINTMLASRKVASEHAPPSTGSAGATAR